MANSETRSVGRDLDRRTFLVRSAAGALGGLGASCLGMGPALAQSQYPDRPIRLIIPFAPGGGSDSIARIVVPGMRKIWDQSIVIENVPAGGTVLGTGMVAKSIPDGYTLLLGSNTIATLPSLHKDLRFDVQKDLTPVSIGAQPFLMVVHPSLPVNNLQELISYVKAHPGQVAYASAGIGSGAHLATELFAIRAGLDLLHVPYQGTGPSIVDLLAGRVQMTLTPAISLMQFVKQNRLRPIGVGDPKPIFQLPEVPPIASVLPGYAATSWTGVFVRSGTPADIVAKINDTLRKVIADEQVIKSLQTNGANPSSMTTVEFQAYVESQTRIWGDVIRRGNITV
jgi:tripartite-type tricarboxylate transporter receptor subunit TctC